jgi:succinyl-diaminopimelate desuccinylase
VSSHLASRLAERTLELCRIDSPIGHEAAIADRVEAWGRTRFASEDVRRVGHSLVFGRAGRDDRPTVGLFGHLDTVPSHPGDPPAHLTETHVVGLGAADMKGGLALLLQLVDEGVVARSPFNVVVVLYEREEGPYAENGLGPVFDACADLHAIDFALCLEPSDNKVQMGCCGALHAQLVFRGKSAHSARPWQGENAVHKAGPLLTELLAREPLVVDVQGHTFREVMSVTLAQGGRARNVVPDAFTLNLNYRFAPTRSLDDAKAEVLRVVDGRAEVTFTDLSPAGPVFSDHPLLRRLVERTGAPVESKQAWTDVARLGALGIPAVNFGPGESAQAHQAGERTSIALLEQGYRMLQAFLEA